MLPHHNQNLPHADAEAEAEAEAEGLTMTMAQQVQAQMAEGIKVMEETRVTQEALSTTGAKPQVEAQANTEVQVMEATTISSEMMDTIQPIKHTTQVTQTAPNKVKKCGAPFAQHLNHYLIQHSSAQYIKHQQRSAKDFGIWDSAAIAHVLFT